MDKYWYLKEEIKNRGRPIDLPPKESCKKWQKTARSLNDVDITF